MPRFGSYATFVGYAAGSIVALRSGGRHVLRPMLGSLRPSSAVVVGALFGILGCLCQLASPRYYCLPQPCTPPSLADPSPTLIAIGVVIVTPIFETIVFQGWIQTRLSQFFGLLVGAVITTALFILMHFGVSVTLLVMAVSFCWIRIRWGSLLSITIAHSIANLGIFILSQSR